jgi:hypothetical protein
MKTGRIGCNAWPRAGDVYRWVAGSNAPAGRSNVTGTSRSKGERGLVVGSTLITVAVTAVVMKATAGMRGQTLRELVRSQL